MVMNCVVVEVRVVVLSSCAATMEALAAKRVTSPEKRMLSGCEFANEMLLKW